MKIKDISDNVQLLLTNHNDEVLYSYGVPVAGYKHGIGHFKIRSYPSPQTAAHITDYLDNIDDVFLVTSAELEQMFLGE